MIAQDNKSLPNLNTVFAHVSECPKAMVVYHFLSSASRKRNRS